MATSTSTQLTLSPLSTLITSTTPALPYATSTRLALPLEIIHNLRYQHSWTSLSLHYVHPTISTIQRLHLPTNSHAPPAIPPTTSQFLISGLPPRHAYIHPDLQTCLLKEGLTQKDVMVQREWVVPMGLGQKPSLSWLAGVFDALPLRERVVITKEGGVRGNVVVEDDDDVTQDGKTSLESDSRMRDTLGAGSPNPKRVLLAMKAQDGLGGDGTVAYYVCMEGEVKPRQNG